MNNSYLNNKSGNTKTTQRIRTRQVSTGRSAKHLGVMHEISQTQFNEFDRPQTDDEYSISYNTSKAAAISGWVIA